jgi:subtilisin family serine protease/subtilisin-like proprotein convertase family protein
MRCRVFFVLEVLSVALCSRAAVSAGEAQSFSFREPEPMVYWVAPAAVGKEAVVGKPEWLRARRVPGATNFTLLGSRVVLQVDAAQTLSQVLAGSPLRLDRTVAPNLFVLQAPDALTAAQEAQRLAALPGVAVSHPVRRRPARLHGPYAYKPSDPCFPWQWHLENRATNTALRLGPDLNVRAAWPFTRGEGVLIGVGDDGIELTHPDLAANARHTNHHNFATGSTNGMPMTAAQSHATAVAGLAAAVAGNRRGVAGVAPAAQLASWVVWDAGDNLVDEERLMDMFQFRSDLVGVQNHSWGNASVQQLSLGALETQGIANAVQQGRHGLGVVIARSAGNDRLNGNDANDDGYAQDPRVIAVGAARSTGRAASYSTPGACLLVATFSGDNGVDLPGGAKTNYPSLCTTDRQGALGYNAYSGADDSADYAYGDTGFSGTSGAAPQIAGLCALLLSANSSLAYRDVQQILILSARQLDLADPDLQSNGAGFLVSHNTGFGVPDAGLAVQLARRWSNRPAVSTVSVTNTTAADIPDDGLRVLVSGTQVPLDVQSIPAFPGDCPHPDAATAALPLVDVGQALQPLTNNLAGKAALIQRGGNYFVEKLGYAAAAGASFAIVYNNVDGDQRLFMNGADIQFVPIPAVFIGQNSGEALRNYVQENPEARAQLSLDAARWSLLVTNTLLCEHVALRVRFAHPRRADVRLTLTSPAGTRSVLHHFNQDLDSNLGNWTFYTTHHFYESSAGAWQIAVSDERPGQTGRVLRLTLTIYGVHINDVDHDGLDDDWEMAHFGKLDYGPKDDPDQDGFSNLCEMILGTDPLAADVPLRLDLSRWDEQFVRLSWPSSTNFNYAVQAAGDLTQVLTLLTNLPGAFPETEWFVPCTNSAGQFYRVWGP